MCFEVVTVEKKKQTKEKGGKISWLSVYVYVSKYTDLVCGDEVTLDVHTHHYTYDIHTNTHSSTHAHTRTHNIDRGVACSSR